MSLLRNARRSVDIAMYAFTDRRIADALIALADRGVRIRLYRDRIQMRDRGDQTRRLLVPNIEIRVKNNTSWNIMHLKAYVVDGTVLREGSANWSPSGEGAACYRGNCGHRQQQDNDLVIVNDPRAVASFERTFERIWTRSSNLRAGN